MALKRYSETLGSIVEYQQMGGKQLYYSPLRYPGGKGKLVGFMKELIDANELRDGLYVEPFAGGAAIAIALLIDNYVSKVVINDIDKSIFAFWSAVLHQTDELCSLIEKAKLDVNTWEQQKLIQADKESASLLSLGFSTFYLNRVNRSGILKGGLIGGKSQTGKWKMDARFKKQDLINRIKRIAGFRESVHLYNVDAERLVTEVLPNLPFDALIYLDPPYIVKGQQLYVNYYEIDDHKRLASTIQREIHKKWIVTYDDTPEAQELYSNRRKRRYSLNYSAAVKSSSAELMFFSDNLVLPSKLDLF